MRHRRSANGFAMIEVLVTILVISFGLMSMYGLLLATKREGVSSYQRTQAVGLANEILERILNNPRQAAAYHTGLDNPVGGGSLGTPARDCLTAGARCTNTELATWDLWNWERRLDGEGIATPDGNNIPSLLEVQGCVVFAAAGAGSPNSGTVRVIVSWRSPAETTDAAQTAGETCGAVQAGTDNGRHQIVLNSYVVNQDDFAP